jgi:hypothetical protein
VFCFFLFWGLVLFVVVYAWVIGWWICVTWCWCFGQTFSIIGENGCNAIGSWGTLQGFSLGYEPATNGVRGKTKYHVFFQS